MKIVVGSKNPVKIEAARQAFMLHFGDDTDIEVIGIDALSNVADQPMSVNETATGAYNRASYMRRNYPDADYAIGIEGGLSTIKVRRQVHGFEQTWACVYAVKDNAHAFGSGPAYGIDNVILGHINSGLDLSDAMQKEHGTIDLGKTHGYNGWLSNNHYDRTESSKIAVFLALSKLRI